MAGTAPAQAASQQPVGERSVIRMRQWKSRHQHRVGTGRGSCDHRYNFLHAAAPFVRLGAKLKPTRRHSEDGTGRFIFEAALLGGFPFSSETRPPVPLIRGCVGIRRAGKHRQHFNCRAGLDGVRDRCAQ